MLESGAALIVEDNTETLVWLTNCVSSAFAGLAITGCQTFTEAQAVVEEGSYVLALVDLGLPDGNGLDLIRQLRRRHPDCHIVVATIYDDDANLFAALKNGARGYILKDQDRDNIVSYLRGIKQQRPALSATSSQRLIDHFNARGAALTDARLTPREIEVTTLLGGGYSVDEAAQALSISPDTVKGYVKSIYDKLQVNNRSELTLAAVRLGLIES